MPRRPGPPKTPSALADLRGHPGHRALNTDEPKPDTADSTGAPRWLEGDARAVWDELAPELHRLGLLTKLDTSALAGACWWWAVFRKSARSLRRGLVAVTPANGKQARPEVAIAHKAYTAAMDVFGRFGVTPSDRTKLHAPTPQSTGGDQPGQSADPHDQLAQRRAARAQRRDQPAPA